ncbi:hypothetical protein Mapa_012021 [Marchantia paleacea]|nr:hypothetical protein Mapa_012021 [Marchantia paleacea]
MITFLMRVIARSVLNIIKSFNKSLRLDWKHNCAEKVDTGLCASSQSHVRSFDYWR